MTVDWRAWRRLAPVWIPAVLLAVGSVGLLLWQTSDRVGRAAQLETELEQLEAEIQRLDRLRELAEADRRRVEGLRVEFERLYGEVFGSLEDRLTRIMRETDRATRGSGLNPGTYGYRLETADRRQAASRLTIAFAVIGRYEQIRQMLATFESSPEFFVVESIGFSGSAEAVTQDLAITVAVSTFLTEADPEVLERLTGGLGATVAVVEPDEPAEVTDGDA